MADVHQTHETLMIIATKALGGGDEAQTLTPADLPRNADELEARMAKFT